jgi:hypothetical protein
MGLLLLLRQADSLSALQPLLPQQKLWQQSWGWGSSNTLHNQQQRQQQQPPNQQQQQQQQGDQASTAPAAAAPPPLRPRRQQQQGQQQQQSRLVRLVQGNSLKMQLKQQLEGLDLTADLAINEVCVDGVTRYATTPLRLAIDLAPSTSSTKRFKLRQQGGGSSSSTGSSDATAGSSTGGSSSWLQNVLFRVGMHGVVAPLGDTTAAVGGSSVVAESSAGGISSQQRQQQQQQREHGVSLHAQGALALTGSRILWEASEKPWEAAATERSSFHKQQQRQQQQQQLQQPQAELAVQPLQLSPTDSSNSTNSGTQQHGSTGAAREDGSSGKGGGSTGLQAKGSSSRGRGSSRSSRGGGGKQRVLMFQGQELQLPLLNPGSVQESLQVREKDQVAGRADPGAGCCPGCPCPH